MNAAPQAVPSKPDFITALRRELHHYPEPAWMEYRTTCRVVELLTALGIPVRYGSAIHSRPHMYGLPSPAADEAALERARQEGCDGALLAAMAGGYTGCVATIDGAHPGRTLAVRVDLDCNTLPESLDADRLPVREGFASCHDGFMHACGHDGHTAIGLALAAQLWDHRQELHGQVRIIFQPAEEGLGGGTSMVEAGVLDGVDILLGSHISMGLAPVGTVAAGTHGFLASTKMDVLIHGRGAHAGVCPEEGRNALAAAAAAVTNLLAISRSGQGASRINVGSLVSKAGRNVIPPEAALSLETRGATDEINRYMEDAALRVIDAAAQMYGCTVEHRIMGRGDCTDSTPELAERVMEILRRIPGVKEILPSFNFRASEDITTMMRRVQTQGGQATELIFGAEIAAPHHSERFDFDEAVLPLAVRVLTELALSLN
jgi:aminobenzoyl-glutamate utilization protein A